MRVHYAGPGLAKVVTGGFGPRKWFPDPTGGFISEEMSEDEALWWADINLFSLVSEPQPSQTKAKGPITMEEPPEDNF